MENNEKVTIKEFAAQLSSVSPDMMEIQVGILVERLFEEHGINVEEETLLRLAR